MEQEKETTTSSDCKMIHVKVIGGGQADIYEIGKAMQEFKSKLPFRLEAIITNDKVELRDVNDLINELLKLKKQLKQEEKFDGRN